MSILESLCMATFTDPSWHDNQWDMTQDINKYPSRPNNHWDMTQDVNKVYIRYGTSHWEKIQARRFWWALKRYVIIEVNGILQGVLFFIILISETFAKFCQERKTPIAHSMANIPYWRTLKKKKKKNFCSVKIFWASFIRLFLKKKREFQRNF